LQNKLVLFGFPTLELCVIAIQAMNEASFTHIIKGKDMSELGMIVESDALEAVTALALSKGGRVLEGNERKMLLLAYQGAYQAEIDLLKQQIFELQNHQSYATDKLRTVQQALKDQPTEEA
jgi:hypothetical protein